MASKLKAVTPKAAEPSKPKVLVYGKPGVGKTWASLDFPSVYYIDTEGGADLQHYTDKLEKAGGVYLGPEQGSTDFGVIIEQVQALASERHTFRTLVIDSISKVHNLEIMRESERLGESDKFGASKKPALQNMRRLMSWLTKLDMNVILIAHEKDLWGDKGKIDVTFDADPKLEYDLHLALNIVKAGSNRIARIRKSRLIGFPESGTFPWSYAEFADRYGRDVIEGDVKTIELASEDQVAEIKRLIDTVKMPDGWMDKAMAKASIEVIEDFTADQARAIINSMKEKLS